MAARVPDFVTSWTGGEVLLEQGKGLSSLPVPLREGHGLASLPL